jgi:hypothetical protein
MPRAGSVTHLGRPVRGTRACRGGPAATLRACCSLWRLLALLACPSLCSGMAVTAASAATARELANALEGDAEVIFINMHLKLTNKALLPFKVVGRRSIVVRGSYMRGSYMLPVRACSQSMSTRRTLQRARCLANAVSTAGHL